MHTDLDNIEKILNKYLEAETTLQEETQLIDYFTGNNVALHLQEYKYMFQYFKQSKSERHTKTIRIKTKNTKRKLIGVAASIALLASIFVYNNNKQKQETQQAYADTQKALEIITTHMSKSTVAIRQLNRFEQTKKKVFK